MIMTRAKIQRITLGKAQSGYAAALAIVLAGVMGMSVFGLYNSGQLTTHKQRQQNAADAVAFSVANLTARNLNLVAYTNRAMVANQVAIGQAVGLMSWANMLFTTSRTFDWIGTVFAWVPGVKAITQALKTGAEALQSGVDVFSKAIILISDKAIDVYSSAQQALYYSINLSIPAIYKEVVEKNDPDVDSGNLFTATDAYSAATYIAASKSFMEQNEDAEVSTRQIFNKTLL